MFKRVCLTVLLLISITSCSLIEKNQKESEAKKTNTKHQEALKKFEKGAKYLDNENYKRAAQIFRSIINNSPQTAFELVTMFNLGISYEGLNMCKSAAIAYRKVIRGADKDQKRMQAQALYRLSHVYECLGDDAKTISSLVDVIGRRNLLPKELGYAEIPARLATAYARIGNRNSADRYFAEAERGLKMINNQRGSHKKKKQLLSRTLYLMGKLDTKKLSKDDSEKYLYSLEYMQRYLLKSVELDEKNWSDKSAKQLVQAYNRVWEISNDIDREKKTLNDALMNRQLEERKQKLFSATINSIELLKKERFPSEQKNYLLDDLFAQLAEKQKELRAYLAENNVGNSLTKENEERFGVKRKGHSAPVK